MKAFHLGLAEYTATNFNCEIRGDLVSASFDGTIKCIDLAADGTTAPGVTTLAIPPGTPLDVTQGLGGSVWVTQINSGQILVLTPSSTSATVDPDIDHDGILNIADPFQYDSSNGTQFAKSKLSGESDVMSPSSMSPRTLKRVIAFIDRNVDDLSTLLAGVSPHVEPILLSDDEPAPQQMVRAVKGRADLDAIHVIAHGRPGEVSFGAGALSLDTMDDHAAELAEVGRMLGGGAIYLWTCETARGPRGAAFVKMLAHACGAPIAASTQRVGAAVRGGRWQLDAAPGATSAPLTAQGVASYAGVLATPQQRGSPSLPNPFLDLSPRKRATAGNNDESAAGGDVVGGTLDVFRTVDSNVVPPIASSSALNGTAENAATSTTAVAAITSANQVLNIGSTDTGSTTTNTSSDLSLSLGSTIFTDTGLTTSITSGGLTRDNTLTLSGRVTGVEPVSEWLSLVQIYDGATLLGTANFTAESSTDWTFVTPALLDGSHSFTAKVTDDAGNTTTTSAVTAIVDTTSPDVTSVSSRVRGSQTGKVVQITLNMSEQVTVFGGTPELLLNDGGTATYASGSGTQALTFEYTVQSNQRTSDLRVIGDILPSPYAIQDLAGNAADLSASGADSKVGSTTTTPTISMTLTGTQQAELFGPSSVNVTFASGATGTLILDASSQFTGTIAGLNSSEPFNKIDLTDIAFGSNTTVTYLASSADTGTLTVSDGTNTANIAILGQYSPTSFNIASDGHGGTTVVDPVLSISGLWGSLMSPWPGGIPVHAIVLPNGKILTYGTDPAGNQGGINYDVWDPATNTHITLPNGIVPVIDEFCSAALIIPTTGQVLITGGDARPTGNINNGITNTNIFDPTTNSLTPAPTGPMAFARWYPTMITLDTGQLLVLGGKDGAGLGVPTPEIYTPGIGWRTLTGANIAELAQEAAYYPRTWQASNGTVITVPTDASGNIYAIDPTGNGQISVVGHTPFNFAFTDPGIMFAPDRCLILNSADGSVWVMDISGPAPVFTQTGSLGTDRIWANFTVLPDGRVMVSGGSAVNNQLTGVDTTVAIWNPSTGVWTSTGADAAVARLYHSNSILLPDATILDFGGGAPGPLVNNNAQIYTPGYLFDASGAPAVRPVIQQAPLELRPGQKFTVRVDNPANIRTLALMPFESETHSYDTTARRIELPFSVQADGSLSATLPNNSALVPPGDWMLFAIGNNGTPSIASTILVDPMLSLNDGTLVKAINVGGPQFTAANGITYLADPGPTTGASAAFSTGAAISGTTDDTLYQSERVASFGGSYTYEIPVANGTYQVELIFAEIFGGITGPGQRVFDMSLENQALQNIDIFAQVGANAPWVIDQTVTVTDGSLSIQVGPGSSSPGNVDNAKLDAFAVFSVSGASLAIAANAASKAEGNTGSTPFTFTVTRSGDTTGASSATYTVSGSGANPANAADFTGALTGTVSFTAGQTSQPITINVAGDTTAEANESFTVTLSAPSAGTTIATAAATGTIINDDGALTLVKAINLGGQQFTAANGITYLADPGPTTGASGTLSTGADIVGTTDDPLYNTERFASGGGSYTYQIPVANGTYQVELNFAEIYSGNFAPGKRVFDMSLEGQALPALQNIDIFGQVGANAPLVIDQTVTVTDGSLSIQVGPGWNSPGNVDNAKLDAFAVFSVSGGGGGGASLAIAAAAASKAEGNTGSTPFTFTVTRSGDTTGASSVTYTVSGSGANPANAADFAADGGVFPTGTVSFAAGQTSQLITINVAGDTTVEPNEGFTVTLSAPSAGTTIATAAATGVILDDDGGALTLVKAINLGGQQFTAANGITYLADPGPTTGASGTLSTGANIVGTTDDPLYNTERFASGGGSYTYQIPVANGTYQVELNFAEIYSGNFAPGKRVFDMSLEGQALPALQNIDIFGQVGANAPLVIDQTVTVTDGSLSIQVGPGWNSPGNVDNAKLDAFAVFSVSGGGGGGASLAIAATDASKTEGITGSTPFTFTVTRSGDTTGASSATYTVSGSGANPANATDFTGGAFPTGTVSFAAGQTSQLVTINVAGNPTVEANEGFTVTLSAPSAGTTIATAAATGTIINDDGALTLVKAINLGGQQFTAANGITYLADPGPTTGASGTLSTGADIVGTTDDPLYNTERFASGGGSYTYQIPVANGTYLVELNFAEIYSGNFAPGKRVFDMSLEGQALPALQNIDIFGQVGANAPLVIDQTVTVTDGSLSIQVGPGWNSPGNVDNAKLDAFAVFSEATPVVIAATAASDTFAFQQGFATTTINNFDPSNDVIQFNTALFANYNAFINPTHTQQVGANTVITYNANETITLTNVTASTLSQTNFKFTT